MHQLCSDLVAHDAGVYDVHGRPRMLKVKDWPPEQHFKERMVRHNQVGTSPSPPGTGWQRGRQGTACKPALPALD